MNLPRDTPANHRRRGLASALLASAVACLLAATLAGPAPAQTTKPNIVVIQTDDQTLAELYASYPDANGVPTPVMPNTLTLLAGAGVTFNRYYVSVPLCCPSRAALLTGRYAHSNKVRGNTPPTGGYDVYLANDIRDNVAVWLQDAGYRTIHIGKFMNGYGDRDPLEVPPGWDDWHTVIGDARLYYGYRMNDNGTVSGPYGDGTYASRDSPSCGPGLQLPYPLEICNHLTDLLTSKALEAVALAPANRPFYLQLDYTAPHGDINPPPGPEPTPRNAAIAAGAKAPRNPAFNERDVSDKPGFVRVNRRLGRGAIRKIDIRYRDRLESLRDVDEGIGSLLGELAARGLLGDTYVFFTSDNGFFQGEHRFDSAKFLPYENSNHLPLLVRGPGIPAGASSNELVGNVDLAPTFLAIAGGTASLDPDGRSLLPFGRDPALRTLRPVLLEGFREVPVQSRNRAHASKSAPQKTYEGIRIGRYKFVRYVGKSRELYDVRRDPYEIHSRQRDRAYSRVRRWLATALNAIQRCSGADCRRPLAGPMPKPRMPKPRLHNR